MAKKKAKSEKNGSAETVAEVEAEAYEYVRLTEKTPLFGLNSLDYEHPLDRRALEALERTPGLSRALSQYIGATFERTYRLQLMSSGIKVTKDNFPSLYNAYHETCEILDMPIRPPFYISPEGFINAFAAGSENPMLAFTRPMVENLSQDELRYVIGHELGHIKSNHGLYRTLAAIFILLTEQANLRVPLIPGIAFTALKLALMKWSRMAEFTCDRAGLLACQNPEAAIRANMKLAGLPLRFEGHDVVDSFIQQAREFEDFDYDMWDRLYKDLAILDRSHPWTVVRAKEILMYVENGEYQRIIDVCQERKDTPINPDSNYCPYCGVSLTETGTFCTGCGAKVGASAEAAA